MPPEAALWRRAPMLSRRGLRRLHKKSKESRMSNQKPSERTAREQAEKKAKLAEQLRANLRRRKAQAREIDNQAD